MIAEITRRLKERAPSLNGRIREGAEFARLLASNSFRDASGGAYVMPLSLRGLSPLDAAGAFVQPLEEVIGIVLVRPSEDPLAVRAGGEISQMIGDVTQAIAGWRPEGAIGPLRLVQGRMINIGAGVLVYQLEFAAQRQLRMPAA